MCCRAGFFETSPKSSRKAEGAGQKAWHAEPAERAARELETDAERDLGDALVERRRARFGPNRLTPHSRRTALTRLFSQFRNGFIYLLLAASALAGLLGEWVDASVIFTVVLIIAAVGYVQEGRAQRALEAVRGMLASKARVVRGGEPRELATEDLVPGDLVLLEDGDAVPADLRLVDAHSLRAQEAALTGESTAVEKYGQSTDEDHRRNQ